MPAYRLDLAYEGTGFHGFAAQEGLRTVQGELEEALAKVFREPVKVVAAGRTDKGVHARGQVVSFAAGRSVDPGRVERALSSMLAPEIAARACVLVDDDFSARFSAKWRSYRYQVLNTPTPDPLMHRLTWHIEDPLDVEAMTRAAAHFVGTHDFASFCRQAEGRGTERTVLDAAWASEGDLKVFHIRAVAFCHQMVRSITGFCVDAGRGRVDPDSAPRVLAARDRGAGRPMAPATGLILWEVGYD